MKGANIKQLITTITSKLGAKSKMAIATDDYVPEEETDNLSFLKDDVITILDRNCGGGMWKGQLKNQIGLFPSKLVQPIVFKPKPVIT